MERGRGRGPGRGGRHPRGRAPGPASPSPPDHAAGPVRAGGGTADPDRPHARGVTPTARARFPVRAGGGGHAVARVAPVRSRVRPLRRRGPRPPRPGSRPRAVHLRRPAPLRIAPADGDPDLRHGDGCAGRPDADPVFAAPLHLLLCASRGRHRPALGHDRARRGPPHGHRALAMGRHRARVVAGQRLDRDRALRPGPAGLAPPGPRARPRLFRQRPGHGGAAVPRPRGRAPGRSPAPRGRHGHIGGGHARLLEPHRDLRPLRLRDAGAGGGRRARAVRAREEGARRRPHPRRAGGGSPLLFPLRARPAPGHEGAAAGTGPVPGAHVPHLPQRIAPEHARVGGGLLDHPRRRARGRAFRAAAGLASGAADLRGLAGDVGAGHGLQGAVPLPAPDALGEGRSVRRAPARHLHRGRPRDAAPSLDALGGGGGGRGGRALAAGRRLRHADDGPDP